MLNGQKIKQFSNEFDTLYSRNIPMIGVFSAHLALGVFLDGCLGKSIFIIGC